MTSSVPSSFTTRSIFVRGTVRTPYGLWMRIVFLPRSVILPVTRSPFVSTSTDAAAPPAVPSARTSAPRVRRRLIPS
jgi:hypothetical protein